jgi:purine-binding chemotaxis protein CheW
MTTVQTATPTTAPEGANPASWGGSAETAAGKTGAAQFVTFTIDDDQYGVDIMAVREIKGWSEITHLPKQPEYVRGVLNLRGVMVPIIDLRCRFGQGLTQATPVHVVIIVQIESRLVGLLGDSVSDIVSVDAAQIQAVPRVAQSTRVDFLAGLVTIEGAMIALIDLPNLLAVQAEESASLSVNETKPAATTQKN